jgi:hypothetical protein
MPLNGKNVSAFRDKKSGICFWCGASCQKLGIEVAPHGTAPCWYIAVAMSPPSCAGGIGVSDTSQKPLTHLAILMSRDQVTSTSKFSKVPQGDSSLIYLCERSLENCITYFCPRTLKIVFSNLKSKGPNIVKQTVFYTHSRALIDTSITTPLFRLDSTFK